MVDVSNKHKSITVAVSSKNGNTVVAASSDTAQYWANKSHTFANQSRECVQEAKEYAELANSYIEGFEDVVSKAETELTALKDSGVQEINTASNEALTTINTRFEEGIGEGVNQITSLVDNSIAEYTEISNQIKQENSEASQFAKEWATSEVIVDNTDYSAKYYAKKAKDNSGIFYDEITEEDIDVDIISGDYVTRTELENGLATKQDIGIYLTEETDPIYTADKPNIAFKSDIPSIPTLISAFENDRNYATQTQVMQAIASIPQFSLSIVNELPTTGAKMTLYLVPKQGTNNDVYDEYIWIEQTSSFEFLGTTAVDLTEYVKNTDYASANKGGTVKMSTYYGTEMQADGKMHGIALSLAQYQTSDRWFFIAKGTLDNVLTQYPKAVVTTEANYNALEVKDPNTLYLIED